MLLLIAKEGLKTVFKSVRYIKKTKLSIAIVSSILRYIP
jgi:hypothetical protein